MVTPSETADRPPSTMTRHAQQPPSSSRRPSSLAAARFGAQRRAPVHGDQELLGLIGLIYDAATNLDAWPDVLESGPAGLRDDTP
jgi:hypothetical protein